MRWMTSAVLLPSICSIVIGCGQSLERGNADFQVAQRQAQAKEGPGAAGVAAPPVVRKIIYTSHIDVVVEDLTRAQEKLTQLIEAVREQGGYLEKQELTGSSGSHRRGSWTIRVPLAGFDGFVAEIEKLGELERSSRDAQDVTEAYTDLEARLRNKESSEKRLLSHLDTSAQLKDTLELERELSRVRGEVEQLQGQLNLLKSRTDLATVSLSIYERRGFTPATNPTFSTMVSRTFDQSWKSLVLVGQGLVLAVVAMSPWVAALCVLLLPIWFVRRNLVSLNSNTGK